MMVEFQLTVPVTLDVTAYAINMIILANISKVIFMFTVLFLLFSGLKYQAALGALLRQSMKGESKANEAKKNAINAIRGSVLLMVLGVCVL